MAAIVIFAKDFDLDHQHTTLVLQFKELCSHFWEVHIFHIYREANNAANYLDNLDKHCPNLQKFLIIFKDFTADIYQNKNKIYIVSLTCIISYTIFNK
ncbi:hypothetical protein LINGRAHAP2_LOCUS24937 [Linum grandiflorum]